MIKRAMLIGATLVIVALLFGLQATMAGEPADFELSEEQSEAIAELRAEYHEEVWQDHAELFGLRDELRELWAADSPDLDAILTKQKAMNEVRARMREARARFGVAALELLTPEQREAHGELIRSGRCPHRGGSDGTPASAEPTGKKPGMWL